jgi:apolipoprotein N-acyltransferase
VAVQRLLLVLLSAGLHALALPPWNLTAVAWVALVPFFGALRGLRPREAALAGLLWGTAAIWGVGYWVPFAFAFYYQQPLWFGLLFALAASIVFAGSYSAGFAACARLRAFRPRGTPRIFAVAALWVAWELARARLLTGDPWLLFGYALAPRAGLAQAADLGGVYLLSFVLVLVNAAVAEMLAARARGARARALRPAAAAALVVAAALAYGSQRLSTPLPAAPRLPVAIVQGNNDLGTQWREEFYGRGLDQHLRMSADAAARTKAHLLVWPESAVTFFLEREPHYQAAIGHVLRTAGAALIVGGPHQVEGDGGTHYFNSAFYLDADGRLGSRYDKTHLLPFAEYFPLRTVEFLRRRFERVRYFTEGAAATPLETRFGRIATVICFEGIFPELVRAQMAAGARLLVNLSNDAWLGRGAGPEQHLAMVALRAVETRTWVVRATTSGISSIIDPFGRVRVRSALFTPEVLDGEVVPLAIPTLYKRVGDAFAYGCLAACAIVALAAALSRRASPA